MAQNRCVRCRVIANHWSEGILGALFIAIQTFVLQGFPTTKTRMSPAFFTTLQSRFESNGEILGVAQKPSARGYQFFFIPLTGYPLCF